MAVNNRVYYAIQQVSFGKDSSGLVNMNAGADYDSTDSAAKGNRHVAHGVLFTKMSRELLILK